MAHTTYTLSPTGTITFTPSGGSAKTMTGTSVENIDFSIESTVTRSNSCGNTKVAQIYTTDEVMIVTITTKDTHFLLGITERARGTLVFHNVARVDGSVVGTMKTITCSNNAVVTRIQGNFPHQPDSTGQITFEIHDNGSDAFYAIT